MKRLHLLTRGSYSDYRVCCLVTRATKITNEEWEAAHKQADEEFWSAHSKARDAFVARVKYEGPESGSKFSALWVASPEYKALGSLDDRYTRAAEILKAEVVHATEVWCDV